MKTSKNGLDIIKKFESFRSKPYLCPASVATIGYGTTIYPSGKKVTMQDGEITESEACVYLSYDVQKFEARVSKLVTAKINQNQFDALVSFAYNLGLENLRKSTLLKKININPAEPTIRNEFGKWIRANGIILKGLVARRLAEANLYFK